MEEGKKENSIYFYIFFQTFIYFKYLNSFYLVVFNFSLYYFESFRYAERQSVKQKEIHTVIHTYGITYVHAWKHIYLCAFIFSLF